MDDAYIRGRLLEILTVRASERERRRQCAYRRTGKYRAWRDMYAARPLVNFREHRACAKKRGVKFTLTFEQFMTFWKQPCVYCGAPIQKAGLDRINNAKGYTLDNLAPCCNPCNQAKMNRTAEEFINHCGRVVRVMLDAGLLN